MESDSGSIGMICEVGLNNGDGGGLWSGFFEFDFAETEG